MGTTKKPAPRRPAGKKATPANGRTRRKVQAAKARKPRSDKGTKVAKEGVAPPQPVYATVPPDDLRPGGISWARNDSEMRAAISGATGIPTQHVVLPPVQVTIPPPPLTDEAGHEEAVNAQLREAGIFFAIVIVVVVAAVLWRMFA